MTNAVSIPPKIQNPTRTVLVVGASYAGHRVAQQLVTLLPQSWRVVVIERNSHFNHLYAFPRVSVVSGHEQKVFIPYTKIFEPPAPLGPATSTGNEFIHGLLTSLKMHPEGKNDQFGRGTASYIRLSSTNEPLKEVNGNTNGSASNGERPHEHSVSFDYLVYALGSHLPPPINIWSVPDTQKERAHGSLQDLLAATGQIEQKTKVIPGSKSSGMTWLQDAQKRIRDAKSIAIIGGGPLGVQFASDIAWVYGTQKSPGQLQGNQEQTSPKRVTLLSSSARILPRFQPWMHEHATKFLEELGVEVLLGARADMTTLDNSSDNKNRKLKTLDGRIVEAEIILFCTGQRPNTDLLKSSFGVNVVDEKTGMAHVNTHLQLTRPIATPQSPADVGHVFVIGDAANAFGALNAGHTAWNQAEVASHNIARLVAKEEGSNDNPSESWRYEPLQDYLPDPHRIKVSLGLNRAINEVSGSHRIINEGKEDLNTPNMWTRRGLDISDMYI